MSPQKAVLRAISSFRHCPPNEFQNIKLGILINRRSASAAEVFTAALKEHKRAWVIGENSYGKGVVQKLFPLPGGTALQNDGIALLHPKWQHD